MSSAHNKPTVRSPRETWSVRLSVGMGMGGTQEAAVLARRQGVLARRQALFLIIPEVFGKKS